MLTTDLVRARRQGNELRVNPLGEDQRARALALAEAFIATARAFVGKTRDELEEALDQIDVGPRDRLVADGLRKLIDDRCDFDIEEGAEPARLRREVFLLAAAARRGVALVHQHEPDQPQPSLPLQTLQPPLTTFEREEVLNRVAAEQGLSVAALERGLYADLRGAQILKGLRPVFAEELVSGYDIAQAQAVLLRAVRVVAEVRCGSAAAYRALLRKLKFLRLLVRIQPIEAAGTGPIEGQAPPKCGGRRVAEPATELLPAGYRIEIDGPYSLFDQVTKYGLQLALALPALLACDGCRLRADVRWGKERLPLVFQLRGSGGHLIELPHKRAGAKASSSDSTTDWSVPMPGRTEAAPAVSSQGGEAELVPDEVSALVRGFQTLESTYDVVLSPAVLHLPGVGVCVPDLLFRHRYSGMTIYFEALGYWSRDAVWRRVELVEGGLRHPILFALSERLRVSEQALPAELPSALYVYKGVMSARAVYERLEALRQRASTSR